MARGRMIDACIRNSEKIAKCQPRTAMLYVLSLTQSDREGRFEANNAALLYMAGKYGRANGWDDGTVAEDRAFLGSVGLWIIYGEPGGELVQVVGFHAHNRTDPSRAAASEIPEPPGYSDTKERKKYGRPPYARATPDPRRSKSRATPCLREEEVEVEVQEEDQEEGEGEMSTPTNSVEDGDHEATSNGEEADRILRCWSSLFVKINARAKREGRPPVFKPSADHWTAQLAAQDGNTRFHSDEQMEDEFARICRCLEGKYQVTFKAACKHFGQRWECQGEDTDPILWQKQEHDDTPGPLAREIAKGLPEMP